jgi:hypothetical protein
VIVNRHAFVGWGIVVFGLIGHAQPQPPLPPLRDRVVGLNITLNLPVGLCTVPSLLFAMAKDLDVPAGGEMLPGRCALETPANTSERISLLGMRFGDALDLLTQKDPRYRVVESNGVVVIRPLKEWSNEKHFLHITIDRLEFIDENIGGALDALLTPLRGPGPAGARLLNPWGKLSLSLGPISVVEGLDAIVRAHGAMRWVVSYCAPDGLADVAMVYLMTYDDHGVGAPPARQRIVDGRPLTCAPAVGAR